MLALGGIHVAGPAWGCSIHRRTGNKSGSVSRSSACCSPPLGILSALPDIRLRHVNAFIPMVDAIMFLGDLITATLLYVQASVFRSRALTVLASGYVFSALMLIRTRPHFSRRLCPRADCLAPGSTPQHGSPTSGGRRLRSPIILYVLLKRTDATAQPETERPAIRIILGVFAAIALAAAMTTAGDPRARLAAAALSQSLPT